MNVNPPSSTGKSEFPGQKAKIALMISGSQPSNNTLWKGDDKT